MAALKEFGWTNPVLIDVENGVIAGHARIEAAKRFGLAEVPCIELTGLTEAQRKACVIADNKLALNAGWDDELLRLDVLDGSPPCQGFSTAGKRKMDDGRNKLFREYVRLLLGLKPKVLVIENVSGISRLRNHRRAYHSRQLPNRQPLEEQPSRPSPTSPSWASSLWWRQGPGLPVPWPLP
jgi:hypothetical protein